MTFSPRSSSEKFALTVLSFDLNRFVRELSSRCEGKSLLLLSIVTERLLACLPLKAGEDGRRAVEFEFGRFERCIWLDEREWFEVSAVSSSCSPSSSAIRDEVELESLPCCCSLAVCRLIFSTSDDDAADELLFMSFCWSESGEEDGVCDFDDDGIELRRCSTRRFIEWWRWRAGSCYCFTWSLYVDGCVCVCWVVL